MSKFGKKPFLFFIFIGFLLNSSCSYLVKNDKHEVYSKPQHGADKFVVAKGYNIHYVEAGEGEPVFLIPGAFSTYRHWNKVIPLLSNHYRLFCIDYLGVGDSDKPQSGFKYTIEEQGDLIVDMMEKLQIPKVHIVGVSYGGAIALNIAARYPERVGKIVSIEGNGINGNKHQKITYGPMADFLRFPLIGEVAVGVIQSRLADRFVAKSVMGKAWDDLSELEKKEVLEIVSQSDRTAARISWFHISRTLRTSKDFSEEAKAISTPVLYLYGENSDYHDMAKANANFLKAHLPDVEVVSFQDGIHDLQLQKPEEVARLILEFLRKNGMNQQNTVNSNNQVSR